ncbi:conserved hypothetical protein [Trichinella spiralis]|uniref:hypothetical protein n=1 Tax=Trichinella spiralis TaxID=6334 RepID=UPI0001EFCC76|nr:conserved hypothetical protein [Trichinella spiralis]
MTKSDRRFLLYNNVYNSILIFCTEENSSILSEHSVWSMDGTFKIVSEWYQQMFTIHVFIADGSVGGGPSVANTLIPALQGTFPGVHIYGTHTAEGDGSWDANQLHP